MVKAISLEHAAHVRSLWLGRENSKLNRLSFIEGRIPGLFSSEMEAERSYLVQTLADERHQKIVSRILRPNDPNSIVSALEQKIEMLRRLSDSLQNDPFGELSREAFFLLPNDVRDLFYWAVWVHCGAPHERDFGKKKLTGRSSLLCEIESPILYAGGKKLCDQALHYYESFCAIERQRDTLHKLQELSRNLRALFANLGDIRAILSQLPSKLQQRMHYDVYVFSPMRKMEKEWGKKQLMRCPKLLIALRNPEKAGTDLLIQYIAEHEETLQHLEQAREVEELERLTLLYSSMSSLQWQALLYRATPRVKDCAREFEEEAKRRVRLNSDHRHLYQWRGAHPKVDGTFFQVFAPNAIEVQLVLTAYGREERAIPMQYNQLGVWEAFTKEAPAGRTYRYRLLNAKYEWGYRTDPFCLAIVQTNGVAESVVCERDSYQWNDDIWMKMRAIGNPLKNPLSIYEFNVELWRKKHGSTLSFRELAHQIVDHHKTVPFTHVELYGVLDNKHDYSWGYQPDHFLAPNRRMGRADDFKYLVDLCHQNGVGVILDWIPTHYKHEHAGDLSQSLHNYDGTNLFAAEESPWETMFFDFDKEETRRLLMASALYWFEKAHVDGLRVDAVSPMVCRNGSVKQSAVDFLKELNRIVHQQFPGVLMIAEETDGFPNVSRPVEENGLGFDVKVGVFKQYWTRHYFKTPYDERGRDEHHFGKLIANLNESGRHERWMLAHSHDDAASGNLQRHSTLYSSMPTRDPWRRFADLRLFHAWNLLAPGAGHMIHMGDELGQIRAWNERLGAAEGAVEWHLLDQSNPSSHRHSNLLKYVGDLNRLYRSKPAFWKHADWGYRPISNYAQNMVIGFHRLDYEGGRLALFFNFSPIGYREYDFPMSPLDYDPELSWIRGAREIFNSDGTQYGGTGGFGNKWAEILKDTTGAPTHFRFAMPPLSVLVFEELWE